MWLPLTCPLLGAWPATQACALTGNQTNDPLVHRPALNPLGHTSQGIFLYYFFLLMKEREKISIWCSTHSRIHCLTSAYVLARDQTHNLGMLRRHSNQLSYPPKEHYLFIYYCIIIINLLLPLCVCACVLNKNLREIRHEEKLIY